MIQIRPLNGDLQRKANDELNEKPERLTADIRILKTWIEQNPNLWINTDDQLLVAFLRGCKHNVEKAKSKINAYYTLKSKFPAMFSVTDVDSERFREIFRLGIFLHLPIPLRDNGPRIILLRNAIFPAGLYDIEELSAVNQVLQDIMMLEDDYAVINGVVIICDSKSFTLRHLFHINPIKIKRYISFNYEALPMRVKCNHSIYAPKAFEFLYKFAKPMLPIKQQERIFMHSNMDSLTKHISLKYLPKEYGGENGCVAEILDEWDKKLDTYRNFFKTNNRVR